ncbi:MAG TPA: helix-turn-helix domain-containing protein [Acidimicrobiales bacterium]|nr:helix-turn-helix domain-containing protein [Acidimicrobiales bacterium]
MASVKRRAYRSGIRRGDAPALVRDAAFRLFSTKGYLATSIEDIAAEAGVARPTVFTAVGPKPVILRTVVDEALAGDGAAVPIAERPWWREAIEEPDPVRSIQLYARNMCRISGRAGLVLRALETAASIDTDAAELWARFQHQRRIGLNEFATTLARKSGALRYDEETITDTMWMLAPDAYMRLVHDAGWPVERFQAWLADLLQRMFLD